MSGQQVPIILGCSFINRLAALDAVRLALGGPGSLCPGDLRRTRRAADHGGGAGGDQPDLRTHGSAGHAAKHGFDRFWRNVRTHTLHDPVAYKRREIGDHYLNGTLPEFTLYT